MPDYEALTEINVLAGRHFRDARLSMKGIPPCRLELLRYLDLSAIGV